MHSSDFRILTDDELDAIAGGACLGKADTDPGTPTAIQYAEPDAVAPVTPAPTGPVPRPPPAAPGRR
jgi:hypothetical protein